MSLIKIIILGHFSHGQYLFELQMFCFSLVNTSLVGRCHSANEVIGKACDWQEVTMVKLSTCHTVYTVGKSVASGEGGWGKRAKFSKRGARLRTRAKTTAMVLNADLQSFPS